jgi:hypothetical protein
MVPTATGSLAQTSSAPKRRPETSVSVGPSDHKVQIKHEVTSPAQWKREPVWSKHDTPVPKTPLFADMSDSELTDTLSQKDDHTNDDMPPLLYGVEANQEDVNMWMPPPSPPPSPAPVPVAISATVSTASSLSSDSSVGLGESISGARPAAPRMGAAGLSSSSAVASTRSSCVHVLFNSVTRKLYPDP